MMHSFTAVLEIPEVHLFLQPRVSNQVAVTELSATFLAAPILDLSQPVSFVKSSAG